MATFDKINDLNRPENNFYHGIIVSLSQKDKSILKSYEIISEKKTLFGLFRLYKLRVSEVLIDKAIKDLQDNMSDKILFKKQEFYFHFYRDNELIIVYKDKIFKVSQDKSTWKDAITYGKGLNISEKQLDFIPNRFENEDY